MKARLNMSIIAAASTVVILTGCVSSKKYHASQAETAKARNDSAQLAQQVASLNGNVHDLQEKNNNLQQSLDKSHSDYAAQEKNLGYYQNYFKDYRLH